MYLDVSDRDRYVKEINQKLDMKLLVLMVDKLGRQGLIKLSHFEVLVTAPLAKYTNNINVYSFGDSNSGLSYFNKNKNVTYVQTTLALQLAHCYRHPCNIDSS